MGTAELGLERLEALDSWGGIQPAAGPGQVWCECRTRPLTAPTCQGTQTCSLNPRDRAGITVPMLWSEEGVWRESRGHRR